MWKVCRVVAGWICLMAAVESVYADFYVDLDRDGMQEHITWKRFYEDRTGRYYRLEVRDRFGNLLWRAPATKNIDSPYFVGETDFGVALPEVAADIDGDGYVELLIPEPQSDVSVTIYHRLRWVGGRFRSLPSAALIYQEWRRPPKLYWQKGYASAFGTWASELEPIDAYRAEAVIRSVRGRNNYRMGRAIIRWRAYGADIVRWITPLQGANEVSGGYPSQYEATLPGGWHSAETTPSYVPPSPVPPAMSQRTIRYVARIGERDHYNSHGMRLTDFGAILRQDRANYYRFGGDAEDEGDGGYFATTKAREDLQYMDVVPVGISMRRLRDKIVYGTPLLEIRIKEDTMYIRVLR